MQNTILHFEKLNLISRRISSIEVFQTISTKIIIIFWSLKIYYWKSVR